MGEFTMSDALIATILLCMFGFGAVMFFTGYILGRMHKPAPPEANQ